MLQATRSRRHVGGIDPGRRRGGLTEARRDLQIARQQKTSANAGETRGARPAGETRREICRRPRRRTKRGELLAQLRLQRSFEECGVLLHRRAAVVGAVALGFTKRIAACTTISSSPSVGTKAGQRST